ncbi:DUF4163 domain-containing protein [Sphingomonas floccifaciens]|uniref:DUF4163 domain-containing protein n=1 Tax=Sphingomonas floccifaciens TaxID=1844115 RepID=A0ABW4N8W2_9SPHN
MQYREFLSGAALVMLTACGGGDPTPPVANTADPVVTTTTATPAPPQPPAPPPAPAFIAKSVASTADYNFRYAIPKVAADYDGLVRHLNADRDKAQASVAKDAAAFRKETVAGGFPFRKYESTTDWKQVALTPRFLSLSAETYDYTGGAHGSPGIRALLWDRRDAVVRQPTDLFVSEAAIQQAIGAAFCDALDIQRAKRRGAPVVRGNGDSFNDCPKVSEATLILGSTDGRAVDRIGLLVGPYVAGSYAEGSYDLTLPVTPALIAAVKPDYRSAFATRG